MHNVLRELTNPSPAQQSGFSLIEMAMVLLIVGILTAGGLRVVSTAKDQQNYQETDQALQQIQQALLGHWLQFGRLPCPDTNDEPNTTTHGHEKPMPATGACTSYRGWLPHIALGIGGGGDAWGNRYRYLVHPLMTELPDTPLAACTESSRTHAEDNISIRAAEMPSKTLAQWAGFAVLSTGKNGKQTNANAPAIEGAFADTTACAGLGSIEQENCDTDQILHAGQVLGDRQQLLFDDRVIWISDLQLIASLRNTGWCH